MSFLHRLPNTSIILDMICELHIVQISIEIYSKDYIFLSFYLQRKFQFKHREIVEQRKGNV